MRALDRRFIVIGILWLLFVGWLVWMVPDRNGARDWFGDFGQSWMAWTFPTALFAACVLGVLLVFTWLALRWPEVPRRDRLGLETTRGDRLFISLLGAAFIFLAWLGFFGTPIWGAFVPSLALAFIVFRWI